MTEITQGSSEQLDSVACMILLVKKGIAAVLVLALVALAWAAYSKFTERRREAGYRAAIAPFQRDLRVGMDRSDVEEYLHSRNVNYHAVRNGGSEADTYEIKIGEEPDTLFCEKWTAYI